MRAFEIISIEPNQGWLRLVERPEPVCAKDEVLIRVTAAGVNRADIFQRQGKYPPPEGVSDIPGLEVAGVVEAVGEGVSAFREGQRVCALLEGGGYAEKVVVKASQALLVPEGWSDVEAAAIPEVLFTVWFNLFHKAKLQLSETVLVHGGSSGIGTMAIALCKLLGIRCIATTTSESKRDALLALGASQVVRADAVGLESAVKTIESDGVDVILDMVGGDYIAQNLRLLAQNGRLVQIAFLRGAKAEVNFAPLLLKNLTVMGTTLRNQPAGVKAAIASDLQQNCLPLMVKSGFKPSIDRAFPFEEAEKAQAYMEENRHIGKIILQF